MSNSLKSITTTGSHLEQLKQLALMLAEQMDAKPEPRVLAPIARQYRETINQINLIEGGDDDNDDIDAIITRRQDR